MNIESSHKEYISKTEKSFFQKMLAEQSFWVTVALFLICFVMFLTALYLLPLNNREIEIN